MVRNKLIVMSLITVLFISMYHVKSYGDEKPFLEFEPLFEIIQVMEENDIEAQRWSIYSKEYWGKMTRKELEEKYRVLQEKTADYSWVVTEDNDTWKAIGLRQDESQLLQEEVSLIAHVVHGKLDVLLQHKASGAIESLAAWQNSDAQNERKELFMVNPSNFYCVEGQDNANINIVLFDRAVLLLQEFSAEKIESISEETFVSLSAYTKHWKNDIPAKDGLMNVQVAIREGLGGSKTVTIGTPIITSEY